MTQVSRPRVARIGGQAAPNDALPYSIELWDATKADTIERVLARAFTAGLARAIFAAVRREHPERRITLRRGARILADSAEPVPQRREPTAP